MRIRTRLSLSYLIVILLTGAAMMVLADAMVKGLAEKNLKSADSAVKGVTEKTYRLSKRILTSYGEQTVELKAEEVAASLALALQGKNLEDYPALRKDRKLRKMATQDVYSSEDVAGYVDVLDNKGVSVWHPNKSVEGRNFSEWADKYPKMWRLVQRSFHEKIVKGYYTFIDRNNRTRRKYMVLVQIFGTPFIVVTAVNIDQYFLPVHAEIRRAQNKALETAERAIKESAGTTRKEVTVTGVLGGIVLLVVIGGLGLWIARSLADPVMRLKIGVEQIGKGNFRAKVEERGSDEIRELARTFNQLGDRLSQYMDNLREATASKERIESELSIAAEIQRSLIPRTFPPFPERDEFEIYALMHPARAVGGDFYDFFFVDSDTLFFTICDVSGKGVPAALYMAVTRSLVGAAARDGMELDRLLNRVNRELCSGNDTCMFSTAICGTLSLSTGRLAYANAGHESPLLIRDGKDVHFLGRPGGPVLGLFEDETFALENLFLEPGDTLFVYTDGVTEAIDSANGFFTRERLFQALTERSDRSATELVEGVLEEVRSFAAGVPQADDITMLALRLRSKKS
jgi:serine phosphatase RsbU (regulator of sigma subunit)